MLPQLKTKRPISPKQVILLVLAVLSLCLAIGALTARWSKIEDKIFDIKLNFDFYLGKVKLHGDASKTWNSYEDFKKHYQDEESCSNFAKKFKKASDAARGLMFLPFVALVLALVFTVINVFNRGSKPLLNTIMTIAWFALIACSLLPPGTWSSSIPSLDDVQDCLSYTDLTYYPVEGGASLFFAIAVIAIIGGVIAILESKSAKRFYLTLENIGPSL
jgi:uncharacterized ion transporter superfamily protein YfcC